MTECVQAKRLPPLPEESFDIYAARDALHAMVELWGRYGDIYRVYSPLKGAHAYVITHPDHIKHVLIDNRQNYRKGGGFDIVKMLLGNGIIVSDGEFWKRHRLMIQPAFQKDLIRAYAASLERLNLELLADWEAKADSGTTIDVTDEVSHLALRNVLTTLFSVDTDWFTDETGRNPFMLPAEDPSRDLRFARSFRGLTRLVQSLIDRRRDQGLERRDILAVLMSARDKKTDEPIADRQLIDEVLTLIVAGHETTAGTMNWAWHLLSRHPEVERRLHVEIDEVLGDLPPRYEDLSKLAYTRQILEETLRLYPPVWRYTRRSVAEDEIGGYHLAPNVDVFISPYITHRHPAFWDAPDEFDPSRFDAEQTEKRHRFAFIPFSAGPRRCIGDHMAMVEMQMHLATVARRLALRGPTDQVVEMEPEVNLRSRQNIHLRMQRR